MKFLLIFSFVIACLNNQAFTARLSLADEAKQNYLARVAASLPDTQAIENATTNREQRQAVRKIIAEYLCRDRTSWPWGLTTSYWSGGHFIEKIDLSIVTELQMDHLPADVILGLSFSPDEALKRAIERGNNIGAAIARARGAKEPVVTPAIHVTPAKLPVRRLPRQTRRYECPCNCGIQ
jgi:hypothetical protein